MSCRSDIWRVEVEDKDISPGLKEILEKSKEKERRTAIGFYHDLLNLMDSKGGVALTDWDDASYLFKCLRCFRHTQAGDYWTRVDGPDVRETGKLCFTDQWSRMFKSFGKPVAEAADWYNGL